MCQCLLIWTMNLFSKLLFHTQHRPLTNEFLFYVNKQSDGEVPIIRNVWGMCEYPFIAIAGQLCLG